MECLTRIKFANVMNGSLTMSQKGLEWNLHEMDILRLMKLERLRVDEIHNGDER